MISQEVEEEGIVLLKNNGVLPIEDGKICVTGAPAHLYYHGGGSSAVIPNRPYMPLDKALKNLGYDAFYTESIGKVYGVLVTMGNLKKACGECQKSDVTILTVGTGAGVEVEEADRQDIKLSPEELDALRYLRKYSKKLVVVVYAGSAVDLSEFDKLADAVVLAGFGGQNVSQAVANVLTGKVNPSGRLTETYAYSVAHIPSEHTYRNESVMVYEEKLNVGYRYFETKGVDVLYPFGYGLTYSEFEYSDLKVKAKDDHVEVSLQVENVSDVDGKEVVQLYVNEVHPVVYRPVRELKAFDKVFVKAHEKVEVKFTLGTEAFSHYSTAKNQWVVNPGNFIIEIRRNAHEIELAERISIDL